MVRFFVLLFLLSTVEAQPPLSPTVVLAGDVSLARVVAADAPLGGLQRTLRADAAYANLESPLTTLPVTTTGFDLRANPARIASLQAFTHLGTENNHMNDGGAAGQTQSRQVLRAHHILPVTRSAQFTDVAGLHVAWMAAFDDRHTPLPFQAIRQAAASADAVIVGVHWGAEYDVTTPRQRRLARELAAAGATLIVGSGPHVLQGHEFIGKTLVLYSLGNLLLDQPYPSARIGAVVRAPLQNLHAACAVPTRYRAGRAEPAPGDDARFALTRLGLPRCPA
ncbi:CapA family protein [Deinococcus sp. UYEF24]